MTSTAVDPLPTAEKMFDLTGKCALLTGAGRGIGLAVARALAGAGCAVAIQDIDEAIANSAVASINAAGGRAVALGGDLTDLSLPATLVPRAVDALGGLHILVNNGSIQIRRHWSEASAEEMELQLRTDLVSPILFCRAVMPIFKAQRFGRIINVGSVQQIHATPDLLAYSLSKGALEKLTIGLAKELAPDQITINQIAPGWIHNTVRNAGDFQTPEQAVEIGRKAVPIGRLGEPDDMRGTVLMLCSDAGAFITGQNIFIDGGMGW